MNANHPPKEEQTRPDFSLLLARLEKQVLEHEPTDKVREMLKNERIWEKLDIEQRLKWAGLAQMAGELKTACLLLDSVNLSAPQNEEGWQAHLDLLHILGKRDDFARVLARARKNVSDALYRQWVQSYSKGLPDKFTEDFKTASTPFEALQNRRQTLNRYLELFCGREDCFARQWVDRQTGKQGYVPVRRPMTHQDLEEHLKGLKTYGFYLLSASGMVKTGVIDVDLRRDYRGKKLTADETHLVRRELQYVIRRLTELAKEVGLHPLAEFSGGKGYHFWFFFDTPTAPGNVRSVLESICRAVAGDVSAFTIEVFPKQDQLTGKGFGNLVKLPLGVHRLTGKRSYFLKSPGRTVDAQLDFLFKVRITEAEQLAVVQQNETAARQVLLHPKLEKWAKSFPELYALESKCPPLGQIMAVCRNQKSLSVREEKILLQTVGFLPRAKMLLHHLLAMQPDYNPHLVDYRLSRVRGTPLGCRRIHSLLSYSGDFCWVDVSADYQHPLLHLDETLRGTGKKSEKVENLTDAVTSLKAAIIQLERFLDGNGIHT